MDLSAFYKVGYILRPHGLKGEVTVSIEPDIPNEFSELDAIFLEEASRLIPYFISYVSIRGSKAFVKFEDIDSPEAADRISKRSMYLPKSARPKSAKGEFYTDEVNDFLVVDEVLGELGTVKEVGAGANPLLILDYQGKEVLIPVNSPFISSVNKSKKKITVNLPEGFLDI